MSYQIEKQPFPQDSEFLDTQCASGIQLSGRIKVKTSQLNIREHPLHILQNEKRKNKTKPKTQTIQKLTATLTSMQV